MTEFSPFTAHAKKCKTCKKALQYEQNILIVIMHLCKTGNRLLYLFHERKEYTFD